MDPWLQFFGRLHPVVLHLPIGALLLLAALELWVRRSRGADLERGTRVFLCGVCALGALAGVATGWLHGAEVGTGGDAFYWHRGFGIAYAGATVLAVGAALGKAHRLYAGLMVLALMLLVPVGHFGGQLTHGIDFLTEPFAAAESRSRPAVAQGAAWTVHETPPSSEYLARVAPILENRCGRCHGPLKQRGGLALHTPELLLLPGDSGAAPIVPGDPGASEILRRMRLAPESDEHMPPTSKPQPSEAELAILVHWIESGASFDAPLVEDARESSQASVLAGLSGSSAIDDPQSAGRVGASTSPQVVPPAAGLLAQLAREHVHVEETEPKQHLLWISLAARPDADDEFVRRHIAPLREFVSELSLAGTAVTDEVLELVARMPRLERLDLSRTSCTSLGLRALEGHPALSLLNLTQTRVDGSAESSLARLPALVQVYTWGTSLATAEPAGAEGRQGDARSRLGDFTPAAALEQEPAPRLTSTLDAEPVNTTCPVTGGPLDPAFAIVFERRVVGFCCSECPATFWASPGDYPVN